MGLCCSSGAEYIDDLFEADGASEILFTQRHIYVRSGVEWYELVENAGKLQFVLLGSGYAAFHFARIFDKRSRVCIYQHSGKSNPEDRGSIMEFLVGKRMPKSFDIRVTLDYLHVKFVNDFYKNVIFKVLSHNEPIYFYRAHDIINIPIKKHVYVKQKTRLLKLIKSIPHFKSYVIPHVYSNIMTFIYDWKSADEHLYIARLPTLKMLEDYKEMLNNI